MIVNQAVLEALSKSAQALYMEGLIETEVKYPRFTSMVPSTTRENVYAWLGEFPALREWKDERVVRALAAHDFTIRNKSFEATVAVDRDDIEDDNIGVYGPMFKELGRNAKLHPEKMIADLMKNGTSQLCYDGQYYFDADHPVGDGTVSNFTDGSGTPWYLLCTTFSIKPFIFQERRPPELVEQSDPRSSDAVFMRKQFLYGVDYRGNAGYGLWQLAYCSKADLTPDSYAAARAAMMSLTNSEGQPLAIVPDLLVVPPTLEAAGREVLMAERDTNGATNVWRGSAELLVWTALA